MARVWLKVRLIGPTWKITLIMTWARLIGLKTEYYSGGGVQ
jgi:hypothetical protein